MIVCARRCMQVERGSYDDFFNIRFITGRSVDDAVEASIAGETYLLVISCKLITCTLVPGNVDPLSHLTVGGVIIQLK